MEYIQKTDHEYKKEKKRLLSNIKRATKPLTTLGYAVTIHSYNDYYGCVIIGCKFGKHNFTLYFRETMHFSYECMVLISVEHVNVWSDYKEFGDSQHTKTFTKWLYPKIGLA